MLRFLGAADCQSADYSGQTVPACSGVANFKAFVSEIIDMIAANYRISQGKTTYRSGITDITGVKMLNNSMTITDKVESAIESEPNLDSLRAKGLRNYANRVKKVSICPQSKKQ